MKHINATNLNRNPGERTQISYFTALPAATYAALRKESRMKSTEATVLNRKSGGAEGPAVRPGSRTKVSLPLVLPQNRHPERSASQIHCLTQRLWRGVEGPRRCLSYPWLSGAFRRPMPDHGICPEGTLKITQEQSWVISTSEMDYSRVGQPTWSTYYLPVQKPGSAFTHASGG
jgi:hypothetical protein